MLVEFKADLHMHTCLSPCAELSMTPRSIVEKASSLGINIIAVCDHNSAENVEVTRSLAEKQGITVVCGLEICSSEEVHIIGLFRDIASALRMQEIVYRNLPGKNDEGAFGMQVVVNEKDEVLGLNDRLLIGATDLSVNGIVELIHTFNGLAVASHIDRDVFGIIGQLGFIPGEIDFDAFEISRRITIDKAYKKFSDCRQRPWISSSDSHRIEDIGTRTTGFLMHHAIFEELRLALLGIEGRRVII
jgi:PHP family Zn ribbon phosphoesterase